MTTSSYESLSHSKWDCKYHLVFIPKWRKRELYGKIRKYLGTLFHELAAQRSCKILEGHMVQDHVHMSNGVEKFPVKTIDRPLRSKAAKVSEVFKAIAKAISEYEKSSLFSKFNSKFDYVMVGKTEFTEEEAIGLALFNGKANCLACHVSEVTIGEDGRIQPPLFTDFTYDETFARTSETAAEWSKANFFELVLALMSSIRLKYAFISPFFIKYWAPARRCYVHGRSYPAIAIISAWTTTPRLIW